MRWWDGPQSGDAQLEAALGSLDSVETTGQTPTPKVKRGCAEELSGWGGRSARPRTHRQMSGVAVYTGQAEVRGSLAGQPDC